MPPKPRRRPPKVEASTASTGSNCDWKAEPTRGVTGWDTCDSRTSTEPWEKSTIPWPFSRTKPTTWKPEDPTPPSPTTSPCWDGDSGWSGRENRWSASKNSIWASEARDRSPLRRPTSPTVTTPGNSVGRWKRRRPSAYGSSWVGGSSFRTENCGKASKSIGYPDTPRRRRVTATSTYWPPPPRPSTPPENPADENGSESEESRESGESSRPPSPPPYSESERPPTNWPAGRPTSPLDFSVLDSYR